jgi:hypothetical protein
MVEPRFVEARAQVAELADALASGASSRKGVEVRVLSWAPHVAGIGPLTNLSSSPRSFFLFWHSAEQCRFLARRLRLLIQALL